MCVCTPSLKVHHVQVYVAEKSFNNSCLTVPLILGANSLRVFLFTGARKSELLKLWYIFLQFHIIHTGKVMQTQLNK